MLVRKLRVMWLMLWTLYALCRLAYSTALITADKTYAVENRVDAIMPVLATHAANITAAQSTANTANTTANNLVSGSTPAGNLDLGNGNLTSLFTGSESVPASVGTYTAVSTLTLAQIQAFLGTGGNGGVFWNRLCTAIDQLSATVSYIQGELQSHNFSSN